MSALNTPEISALYVAIGISVSSGERATADELIKLKRRLEALCECATCGSYYREHTAGVVVCAACAELEQREDNERHDAEREGLDYHEQPLAGGGR